MASLSWAAFFCACAGGVDESEDLAGSMEEPTESSAPVAGVAGTILCPAGQTFCGGQCISATQCGAGTDTILCPAGQTFCGGQCISGTQCVIP